MPPRMRTRSAGQPVAESRGGGTGERVGRGGRCRGPRGGVNGGIGRAPDFSTIIAQQLQNLLPAILAKVSNQGNVGNQNGNVVNENIQENVRNVLVNGNRVGCSYKEFLACNPKEYDGKGGAVVLTRWIEKMESVQDMSGCSIEQKKVVQISSALTDEAVRNGSIKKIEKRGNVEEPSKDKNGRDDNKRIRTGDAFATNATHVRRENTGAWPKCTTCNSYHAPGGPCYTCFNCNRPCHFARDCRIVPENVNPVNVRNQTLARGACH
nr:reverse transcriptase domain-containing protein [Tanacetum cinerariifolium]